MPATAGWKGDSEDGDPPKWGKKVRRWFARAVHERVQARFTQKFGEPGDDWEWDGDAIVEWFVAHRREFAEWKASDTYGGPGYSAGYWTIDWAKFDRTFPHVYLELGIHSLEQWLMEDLHRRHYYTGQPGSKAQITTAQRKELHQRAMARRRRWPILCPCGAEFTQPEGRTRGKPFARCETCRAQATPEVKATKPTSRRRNAR